MACDPLAWGETVSTNLLGTYYPIRALFDLLLAPKPGRGKVIVFSGGGATKARPYFSAYGVSKTAVVRLAETLANEWEKLPIDINAVAPGAIYTAMTEEAIRLGSGVVGIAEYESALRLRQQGTTAVKTVELVNFLLSPQSDHLSGKLISAPWDPWPEFAGYGEALTKDDIYTLRRTVSKGKT
jgi:3-oxoacyl-[acyl-carrier protein] reductase